ncbi:hypothetical protein Z043_120568 [Scleropages formosus]|uniref:Uncharacterized protein n=1 Tax=Scleropages formosus TaxID=113540 RepID=A0A0P7TUL4_SCLFO|nr:hypothetical protein Z043_120568 [Scleropages formosus]
MARYFRAIWGAFDVGGGAAAAPPLSSRAPSFWPRVPHRGPLVCCRSVRGAPCRMREGGDLRHHFIVSDLLPPSQNYDEPPVMALAVPVAVKFLRGGDRELSRNMSSYLSLAAIGKAELLASEDRQCGHWPRTLLKVPVICIAGSKERKRRRKPLADIHRSSPSFTVNL